MSEQPIGTTFECDLEGFKRGVAEFTRAVPTLDRAALESGFKAVALLYFGLKEDPKRAKAEIAIAVSYFNYASRRYAERDIDLLQDELAAE